MTAVQQLADVCMFTIGWSVHIIHYSSATHNQCTFTVTLVSFMSIWLHIISVIVVQHMTGLHICAVEIMHHMASWSVHMHH
jgi:hypothetical protein